MKTGFTNPSAEIEHKIKCDIRVKYDTRELGGVEWRSFYHCMGYTITKQGGKIYVTVEKEKGLKRTVTFSEDEIVSIQIRSNDWVTGS